VSDTREHPALEELRTSVRGELLERLQFFRLEPLLVIDLGAGSGAGSVELRRRFPRARVIAVDAVHALALTARRRHRFWRRIEAICADSGALPLKAQCADLVFSSLLLPFCADPLRLFTQAQRVLRPGGLMVFSALGPGASGALRGAIEFDMPPLAMAMAQAGFSEPVLDCERYRIAGEPAGVEVIFGAGFAGAAHAASQAPGGSSEYAVPLAALGSRGKPS
jgi:malonyl-CoA O-methyltransferase